MIDDAEHTIKLNLREISKPSSKRPVLVVIQGQTLGLTCYLTKERTVIGRGSIADIVLRDEIASRQHAEIICRGAQNGCLEYFIGDLESTNGTFLNGVLIRSEQLLQDGDKIEVGKHLLKFALLDESEAEFQEALHRMTQHDELTGLRSRRSLFMDLDREVVRESRSSVPQPITVFMMDLDFFKNVNDLYGHLVGSETIKEVGQIIKAVIGDEKLAGRYGGEEYLAYIRAGRQRGYEIAEEIRKKVEAHIFSASPTDSMRTLRITISLGLCTFPEDAISALELVQKSDLALYRAKQSGRNCTKTYDPKLDKPDPAKGISDLSAIVTGPADTQ